MGNFFLAGFNFKGVCYMKLKMISIFWWTFLSKRKDITDPSHHYWIFKKYVNPCPMGANHQYTGRSFSFLVLNSIVDVKKSPWTTVNFYSSWESVFLTSGIKLNTKKCSLCPVRCAHLVCFCQLLQIGSTVFHFPRVWGVPLRFGVKLYSLCWKKVSYLYHIYTPGERFSPTSQIRSNTKK